MSSDYIYVCTRGRTSERRKDGRKEGGQANAEVELMHRCSSTAEYIAFACVHVCIAHRIAALYSVLYALC